MTKTREMIQNRIELLEARTQKENSNIVKKLKRELRRMEKAGK